MTETIKAALLALESPGSFATRLSAATDALQLFVTKVGAVDFPVTPATVKRLLAIASRSPYGRREQTLVDPTVRSGWEVAKSRIKIDGRRWNPVLREILDALHEQLGTPGRLSARLDKLTIYGPGEFFKAHQDTEKSADMIGTLVVLLPSRFSGGSLRVDRQGEKIEFRRTAKAAAQLEILGFYADCHHEVRPIKSGHRIALVYQLCAELDAAAAGPELDIAPDQLESLELAVASHFETPQPVRYARDGQTFIPEKLVYLLDHQYTAQSLAWTKLKHADALRAAALREVAGTLDHDIHLALVDVHETWQCAPKFTRRRWSPWGGDEDYDTDDGDYELLDLVDSDVVLRHCQDASGKRVKVEKLHIDDAELCFTTANDDLRPFESEYEGYMGNYGETLDRWYHRAAIVSWPKANAFMVKARLNPRAAVRQLLNELKKPSTRTAARGRLSRLLEVWPSCIGREPSTQPLLETLELAVVVDDESLAEALLEPMRPELLAEAAILPLLDLVVRYGMDWCQGRLDTWHRRPWWSAQSWQKAYSRGWLAKLVGEDTELGLELAHSIVAKQWDEVRAQLSSLRPARLRSPYSAQNSKDVIAAVADMLHSSMIVDAPGLRDSVIATLVSNDAPLTVLALAELADRARDAWGVEQITEHCRGQLEAELAKPVRAVGDWSITIPRTCKCSDCATLHEFLESNQVHMSWPLAKGRRAHIHGTIDSKGLPVTHTTKRTGRPHKLELTKTAQLAALETKLRRAHEKALDRLRVA